MNFGFWVQGVEFCVSRFGCERFGVPGLGSNGVGIRGTLGDIDPFNEVPFKRATSPFKGSP